MLESLGIEKHTSDFNRQRRRWRRAGLQYELKDLETSDTSDTAVMKHKPGCTEMVILLLARWSFSPINGGGGCTKKEYRCACESLLRTLCRALHEGQTIKMPFSRRHDVKRHECGAIVGKDIVFLSVQQDGIVDLSGLRARAQNNRVAQVWVKHLDLKFGCEGFDLVDLLRWSETSAYPHMLRNTFPMQVVWNIGRALEKFILVNLSAEGVGEVSGLRLECEVSPCARHRCFLRAEGVGEVSGLRLEEEPVLEVSEFPSKHREATLHVRGLPGDGYHRFTVFLFDALCCGSFAHWSIKRIVRITWHEKNLV